MKSEGNPVHPDEISLDEGRFLVRIARRAVEEKLINNRVIKPPENLPEKFYRPGMTFTTIETLHPNGETTLRGCIGYLMPVYSLIESTIRSALDAALNDPRFDPLTREELDTVVFEVTVLSVPERIEVDDRRRLPEKIVIGKHGLVAERMWMRGTLLPVVPVEFCWDEVTFLAQTCLKAGMPPDCWLDKHTLILAYTGRVFREKTPRGEVYERNMSEEYRSRCLNY